MRNADARRPVATHDGPINTLGLRPLARCLRENPGTDMPKFDNTSPRGLP
jgi:hypothetical protein